jgi:tryptophan synthase alpha subunit
VARFADGVVVGSQLVKALAAVSPSEAPAVALDFARRFRAAIDRAD